MSAFIVGKAHIDTLVTFARDNGVLQYCGDLTPDQAGELLWAQNYRSVNHRYGEQDNPPSYRFQPRLVSPNQYTGAQILKACDCFDYQACETADYHNSKAADMIQRIRKAAIRKVTGYDKADWEIRPKSGEVLPVSILDLIPSRTRA